MVELSAPVRTLVLLKGKLTLRQFTRERGRILGAIIALVIFGPLVVTVTIGSAIGYSQLPYQWPTALLGGILVGLWLIWLVFPIIFSSINEGLDVTRLLVFPLTQRQLVLSTLLGTLFDYPTYLVIPLLGAMLWGFGRTVALPVLVVALLLSYAHMIIIGQLVITAVGGILQSRRFRDVSIVVASLLGSSCYFLNLGIQRVTENLSSSIDEEAFLALQPLDVLQWFPTGAGARAVEQALNGAWAAAIMWLLYSAVILLALTWLWMRLLTRLATGDGFLINLRPSGKSDPVHKRPQPSRQLPIFNALPADIKALAQKELKSIWRIPQRRIGLIQGLVFPIIMGGGFFLSNDTSTAMPSWASFFLLVYALFTYWVMMQNMLAWEGSGLPTLLLTPIPRARIFWAKGVTLMSVATILYLVIAVLTLFVMRSWLSVATMLTGVALGGVVLSVTAVSSVIFPIRINLESKQLRSSVRSTGGGCLASLGSTFVVPLAIAVLGVPAAVPLLAAWWWDLPWLGFTGILFSVGYSGVLFWGAAKFAGNLLLEREAELLAALKAPEQA